jgi:hypothetical protein
MNPIKYHEDASNHGSYVYVSLDEMVGNFIANYTGDGSILINPSRSKIIYQFKQGIKKFSMNALREVKAIELELGDTLDITLPHDYVNYVRISYVNPESGELMVLSSNDKIPQAVAHLQDHEANLLFDEEGFILEGSTYLSSLNDTVTDENPLGVLTENYEYTNFILDPTINANGTFNINTRTGKIHFSSDNAIRVIVLEYISDGLEYGSDAEIKIAKQAEEALYNFVNYELMRNIYGIPMYEKNEAKKMWFASYRNAKIALMNVRISDVMLALNGRVKIIK